MSLVSFIAKQIGRYLHHQVIKMSVNAIKDQSQIFYYLITKAKETKFGKDHQFTQIENIRDYQQRVPIRDYEQIKNYIEEVKHGGRDILWPGKPLYFAKTSGTTSGVKYIPISKDSMPYHFASARNAVFNYAYQKDDFSYLDGKSMFLSGSPETSLIGDIPAGRLSGLVNLHIPALFKKRQLPSFKVNCIEDWDTKVDKIIEECLGQDLRLLSGIPPWVQMFSEKMLVRTNKQNMLEVFPNLTLIVSGGVNFAPYKTHYDRLFGQSMPRVDTYPASEGFIGFQFSPFKNEFVLNTNSGIFFEFVTPEELKKDKPRRIDLSQVQIGETYALLMSTNAGLWCYNIGDTIEFTSTDPYLFVINGRISQYISAFGEHVIEKEIESALMTTCADHQSIINEYTVAPQVNPKDNGKPYHEWMIDFEIPPSDLLHFAQDLDLALCKKNIYYQDLIAGNILRPLVIQKIRNGAFIDFMRSIGKLGGQNKIPHLRNDRKIADGMTEYIVK